ncbi:hypothetical protein GZ78_11280 [Endozoicomonas numazuensis]|uniref:Uncharacterized protein n=1 Tax=Endozoicomonas numazuensis TaxID=1137799 RepID=A0A081NI61_9GAMM|nr:hypothetical protein GZ78_11280 [Endozoicomonas numazuensis]
MQLFYPRQSIAFRPESFLKAVIIDKLLACSSKGREMRWTTQMPDSMNGKILPPGIMVKK